MREPGSASPADNRLASFNGERAAIVDEVVRRVMERQVQRAAREPALSLEYVLNDAAFSEIRRLEQSGSRDHSKQKQLARWRDLAAQLNRMSEPHKREELARLVRHHAQDVAGNFNPRVYRFARDVMPPAVSFLLNPISGLRDGLQALGAMEEQIRVLGPVSTVRALCDLGTLVFTPTHSSNLDSIVLGLGLMRSGLPPVTYGAGKNLFSNPFVSYFMHNLGAYRVDRRLRFAIYKEVLKEYSTVLLERGFHSLFFPGGTRCRSGEVESRLKLGLLGTSVSAFYNNAQASSGARRIFIVPVTINYRLVLEAETLIEDYLAETGQSRYIIEDDEFSRLGRIVEFARKILAHEGAVVLKLGAPLDPFGNVVDETGASHDRAGRVVDPVTYMRDSVGELSEDVQRDAVYTRILGTRLTSAFARDTIFLGTHVVARAYFEAATHHTGITDIYRLLRLPESAIAIALSELCVRVDEVCRAIRDDPAHGSLDPLIATTSPADLVEQTLAHLSTYHLKPVLYKKGDNVRVGSMKLLYYYQNRTSQVSLARGGANP